MNEYWKAHEECIFNALDYIDDALEEYDETYGLAWPDLEHLPDAFKDLKKFFVQFYDRLYGEEDEIR